MEVVKLSKTIIFNGSKCVVELGKYPNGNISILLHDEETGESALATTNLAQKLPEGHVYIKDYSENEGMLTCLIKHRIVRGLKGIVRSGFVEIPVCELLIK